MLHVTAPQELENSVLRADVERHAREEMARKLDALQNKVNSHVPHRFYRNNMVAVWPVQMCFKIQAAVSRGQFTKQSSHYRRCSPPLLSNGDFRMIFLGYRKVLTLSKYEEGALAEVFKLKFKVGI